jgi:ribonuclease HII
MKIETLIHPFKQGRIEAGCDEAGRGCLAGPVCAAAVILPDGFFHPDLNDSKQVSENVRNRLRTYIEERAISYAVAFVNNIEIDRINILKASIVAMHYALDALSVRPEHILVDGNRFVPYRNIEHTCFVKGDSHYAAIAAASILAKTHRDEYMVQLANEYPDYQWNINKGYPTERHRRAIEESGITQYHRKSFIKQNIYEQINLF